MTPPKIRPFATIVAGRSPREKVHASIGAAKNALVYSPGCSGTVWGLDEHGEWQLLYEVAAEYIEPTDDHTGRWVQHVPWRDAA